MEIVTSCYRYLKGITFEGYKPIAISIGLPAWFSGAQFKTLAPDYSWVKMARTNIEEYKRLYLNLLNQLDHEVVLNDLQRIGGNKIALLCWEAPGKFCHRILVANWLREKTGIEVDEWSAIF